MKETLVEDLELSAMQLAFRNALNAPVNKNLKPVVERSLIVQTDQEISPDEETFNTMRHSAFRIGEAWANYLTVPPMHRKKAEKVFKEVQTDFLTLIDITRTFTMESCVRIINCLHIGMGVFESTDNFKSLNRSLFRLLMEKPEFFIEIPSKDNISRMAFCLIGFSELSGLSDEKRLDFYRFVTDFAGGMPDKDKVGISTILANWIKRTTF